jgi:hypothetical protein
MIGTLIKTALFVAVCLALLNAMVKFAQLQGWL